MYQDAVIVAVLIGLVEVLKRAFGIPKRFVPLTALILGILISILVNGHWGDPKPVFTGIVYGLSAVGLYSGAKNTVESHSEDVI